MNYIDGFVAAVPNANKAEYLEHAEKSAVVFMDHGAVGVVECWGDDVPDGEVTSFPMAGKGGEDETVVFSWISWPSKEVRDEGMQKIMEDERMTEENNPMPFDGKRLIYGGFQMMMNQGVNFT